MIDIKRSAVIKLMLLVLLIAGIVVLQLRFDIASYFTPQNIETWLDKAGPLAPLFYMGVMALAVIISPIPSLPLDVAAGIAFGPWLGTLYSALGALVGAVGSFMIARLLGRGLIEHIVRGHINFCTACSDKLLTKIVFLSRLIPAVSFDIISYGAGLTPMSVRKFALATFLGMLPLTFLYNAFGHVLLVSKWVSVIVGAAFLFLFFFLPRWIEKHNFLGLRKYFHIPSTDAARPDERAADD